MDAIPSPQIEHVDFACPSLVRRLLEKSLNSTLTAAVIRASASTEMVFLATFDFADVFWVQSANSPSFS